MKVARTARLPLRTVGPAAGRVDRCHCGIVAVTASPWAPTSRRWSTKFEVCCEAYRP